MTMRETFGDVSVEISGHVAIIEIDRPPLNFVSTGLMSDLADVLARVDVDRNLRCSVLQTAGKVFCAGADLSGDDDPTKSGLEGTRKLYAEAVRLYSAIKPIVALVQGAAVGAGLGLALVADFRIASPEARFASNFVKLGFHPGFGISHALPRLIGEQKALLMCLTGRRIKAEQALQWQLVDEIVPADQLRAAGLTLAREIAENAPLALTAIRATMRGSLAAAVKAQSDLESVEQLKLRQTEDFAEGVRAVRERRAGQFTGR
jgi:enoyl-CoA hydratase/carnithine racemase